MEKFLRKSFYVERFLKIIGFPQQLAVNGLHLLLLYAVGPFVQGFIRIHGREIPRILRHPYGLVRHLRIGDQQLAEVGDGTHRVISGLRISRKEIAEIVQITAGRKTDANFYHKYNLSQNDIKLTVIHNNGKFGKRKCHFLQQKSPGFLRGR